MADLVPIIESLTKAGEGAPEVSPEAAAQGASKAPAAATRPPAAGVTPRSAIPAVDPALAKAYDNVEYVTGSDGLVRAYGNKVVNGAVVSSALLATGAAISGVGTAKAAEPGGTAPVGNGGPQATPDNSVHTDFVGSRAVAQNGGDQWIQDLVQQNAGKMPPAGAAGRAAQPPIGEAPLPEGQGPADVVTSPQPQTSSLPIGQRILNGAESVANDVALGAIDAPRQILGGVLDYGNNLMRFADDVVKKAEDAGMPNVYFRLFDTNGNWSPEVQSAEQFRAAQAAGADDVLQVPTTGAPGTVTGNIIRTGTTFLVGRMPFLKGAGLIGKAGSAASKVGTELAADFGSGVTSQDPNQLRLSNLIQRVDPNFLTEWLQANPKDEDKLLERLKAGLEYAGLGAAFAGAKVVLGHAKAAIKGEPDIASLGEGGGNQAVGQLPEGERQVVGAQTGGQQPFLQLGDPVAPAVTLTHGTQEEAMQYLEGGGGENPVHINLARIGSEKDIKDTLAAVSTMLERQGVQSNDATILMADSLGMSPQQLIAGYSGKQLNAAETTAMRFMLDSSAQQLVNFAKAATDPATATPEAQALFMRAFATHRALQLYAENAATEAGRTLQSWAIMSQQRGAYAKAIQQLIAQSGEDASQVASKIATLDPLQASRLVASSAGGNGRDTFMKLWYNALLSNPRTVIKKLTSDAGMALWNVTTRYAAETYGGGAVPVGETAQLAYGYISSMTDGIRLAGKSLLAGKSQFFSNFQSMDALSKTRFAALAQGAPELLTENQPTAAAVQYLRAALPTSWIGAADDFAKFTNYRAELRSLAYRDGTIQGMEGAQLSAHIGEIMNNTPQDIHEQAVAAALKNTFQEPLAGLALKMQDTMDAMNIPLAHTNLVVPVGRILMPFIKVPLNIMKWSYRNSALGATFQSDALRGELGAGGAARELAIAKMTLGSGVALGMADLALNNMITGKGPTDSQLQAAWRRAGNEPYSVKVGDKWYGYNQIEPMGLMTGAIADTFGIMRYAKEDGRENLAASISFGIGNAILSKTYMSGLSSMFDALNNPDRQGGIYVDRLMASFAVPTGVSAVATALDPWVRAHNDLMTTVESKTPGLSSSLPPLRDLWGDAIRKEDGFMPLISGTGLARAISPIPFGPTDDAAPIDKWVWANRKAFPQAASNKLGLSKLGEIQTFSAPSGSHVSTQVQLTPQEYDRLQVLAGHLLKDPVTGLGAKDYLNTLVMGTNPDTNVQGQWNGAPAPVRALIVQTTVNKFREAAKKQITSEFPDIRDAINAGWENRAQQLQPAATP